MDVMDGMEGWSDGVMGERGEKAERWATYGCIIPVVVLQRPAHHFKHHLCSSAINH